MTVMRHTHLRRVDLNLLLALHALLEERHVTRAAKRCFLSQPAMSRALVKACKAQAIVLVFALSDRDGVNKLIAATQLKLALARSGCGSNVPNGPPK
jgi:hypothetical protein